MLDHLTEFPPKKRTTKDAKVVPLEKASADQTINAQIKTTEWLESLGVQDDQKVLDQAQQNAARKVFTSLASAAPVDEAKQNLTQLKTPEAVRHLVAMLAAYDWEFVEQARQLRGMAVAKILEETNHPDAKIRLKALEMLGRVTEVGLFTEKVEIKKPDMSDAEIDGKIKDKLNKFMQVVDVVDVAEPVEGVDEPKPTDHAE
jgi:hypothetical protein